jgi:phytoene dehydrogenase-like protein
VAAHLRGASEKMRLFLDAQLLISAQATSESANALYGAAALDLPRRGITHLAGGIGAIAETLVDAVRRNGGRVLYRHEVIHIRTENGRPVSVETQSGDSFPADLIFINLTPWNAAVLLDDDSRTASLRQLPPDPDGWGAFMIYVGLASAIVPVNHPLHHQIVVRRPLGEGNTIFASLSPAWDSSRAPSGRRALTLSTHTRLQAWWQLYEHNRMGYSARRAEFTERVLAGAELALPGLRDVARLILPGTPVTFQHFTRRKWGWVGGFPQTSLGRSFGPRLGPNLWLVGDSIFPGQSTAAVALGGLRVARIALQEMGGKQSFMNSPAKIGEEWVP